MTKQNIGDITMNKRTFIGLVNFLLVLTFALFQVPAYGVTGEEVSAAPRDPAVNEEAASQYTLRPTGLALDAPAPTTPEFAPGRMIIMLREDATLDDLEALNKTHGVISSQKLFPDAPSTQDQIRRLKQQRAQLDNPTHTSWYWWKDVDSKEAQEYEARLVEERKALDDQIAALENLVARREKKQKTSKDFGPPKLDKAYLLEFHESANIPMVVEEYTAHPGVAYAEPDRVVEIQAFPDTLPDDLYVDPDQDGTWSQGTWGQAYEDLYGAKNIEAHLAWPITQGETASGAPIIVAVIDTGVDRNHEDLAANMWTNAAEIPGNSVDDDNNGFVDDVYGWDFSNNDNAPRDGHGHGTHCAGTIAAVGNNTLGIIGVAPKAKIMAVKGLSDGGRGYASELANCVKYAVDNGAHILSNSWGGRGTSQILEDAFHYAYDSGVVAIAAAGNSNADYMNHTPCNVDTVISVAALDANDIRASFSNWGEVDIAAPGVDILSARSAGTSMGRTVDARYTRASGTSMACPHTAGVAALVASRLPVVDPETVKTILLAATDPLPDHEENLVLDCDIANAHKVALFDISKLCFAGITTPARGTVLKGEPYPSVEGIAYGEGFSHYTLDYANTADPNDWTTIVGASDPESTIPKAEPGVLGTWDTRFLTDMTYKLRLRVFNDAEPPSTFISKARVVIENAVIARPHEGEFLSNGNAIEIKGTACGYDFVSYEIHLRFGKYGEWTDTGITLEDGGAVAKPGAEDLLGALDTTVLQEPGEYQLRLIVVSAAGTATRIRTFYVDPNLKLGFPVKFPGVLRWWGTPVNISPIMVNQVPHLAFTIQNKAYTINTQGEIVHEYRLPNGGSIKRPSVADLDGDGTTELISNIFHEKTDPSKRFCPWKFRNYAVGPDGTPLAGWEENWLDKMEDGGIWGGIGYHGWSTPAVADFDGDNDLDVAMHGFCGSYRDFPRTDDPWNTVQRLYLLDNDGDLYDADDNGDPEWSIQLTQPSAEAWSLNPSGYMWSQSPAVVDLDGNGTLEFLIWNAHEGLVCLAYDGTILWNTDLPEIPTGNRDIVSSPVVANLDNDAAGTHEVIIGGGGGKLYVFDHNGNLKATGDAPHPNYSVSSLAIADFDNNDTLEIVAFLSSGWSGTGSFRVFQYDADSGTLTAFPRPSGGGYLGSGRRDPIVGDVNGDGIPEIIMMGYRGVTAYAHTGECLWHKELWGDPPPSHEQTPPVLMDLDSDGTMDLFGVSTYNNPDSNVKSDYLLFAWEMDAPATAENMPWPVYRQNPQHTGAYPSPAPPTGPPNDPPAFTNLPAERDVNENSPLTYTLTASDPEDDSLTYAVVGTLPEGASFSTDTLTWTPTHDQSGSYTVTFSVTDNNNPAVEGTLSITVNNVNRTPTAQNDSYEASQNDTLTVTTPGLLSNDSDPDNDPLTTIKASDPDNGELTFNTNGSFTYSPNTDFTGTDTFAYTANDGTTDSDPATVTITVTSTPNQRPTLDPIANQRLDEGQTLEVPLNATDPDGDTITLSGVSLPAFATLQDNGDGTGKLILAPQNGHNGTYRSIIDATDEHGARARRKAFSIRVETPPMPPGEYWPVGPITRARTTNTTFTWPAYHDAEGNQAEAYLINCRPFRYNGWTFRSEVVFDTHYTHPGTLDYGVYSWFIQGVRIDGNWRFLWPPQSQRFTVLYDGPDTGPAGFEPASTIQGTRPIFRWDLEAAGYPPRLLRRARLSVVTRTGENYAGGTVTLDNNQAVLRREFEPGQYMWFMTYRSIYGVIYTDWAYFTVV